MDLAMDDIKFHINSIRFIPAYTETVTILHHFSNVNDKCRMIRNGSKYIIYNFKSNANRHAEQERESKRFSRLIQNFLMCFIILKTLHFCFTFS